MSTIGTLIKGLRKERDLSQKELAQISEVSVAVLSRIENGDTKVSAQSLIKILIVFGLELGGIKPGPKNIIKKKDSIYFDEEDFL